MGNILFGTDIAAVVASAIGGELLEASLTAPGKVGERDPTNLAAGLPAGAPTVHIGRGILESYKPRDVDGQLIKKDDRKMLVLVETFEPPLPAEPDEGWKASIEGTTFNVVRIEDRDPAAATYLLQVRT